VSLDKMSLKESLKELGMSERGCELYVVLLRCGVAGVAELSALSGLRRSTVVSLLEQFQLRGLVSSSFQGKRKNYNANKPISLFQELNRKQGIVQSVLPELDALYNAASRKPVIQYYEGVEGVRYVETQLLNCQTGHYFYMGSLQNYSAILGLDFMKNFTEKRLRRNINCYGIRASEAFDTPEFLQASEENRRALRYFRCPFEEDIVVLYIVDNKLLLVSSIGEAYGLIIESRQLVSLMTPMWRLLWQQSAKKPLREFEDFDELPAF